MSVKPLWALFAIGACTKTPPIPPPVPPPEPPVDAARAAVVPDAVTVVPAVASGPEVWLRGSTHVHAKPSGDSATPIPDVIAWYEQRGYDFIALTDHNRTSEVGDASTQGSPAVHVSPKGFIVLAGIELTYNPVGCLPPGHESGQCRIHVNLLGNTGRVDGKLEWANRKNDLRVEKYQAAIDQQKQLGGIAQLNHPQWYWGMTPEVLTEVARRGIPLVEIANVQFETWNAGDGAHPSTEALWDAALANGVTLWGVASDDAHHYGGGGRYPAGGGWVVVKARRDPQAIVDALARGRFYASTGVTLARAEVERDELVVEVAPDDPGSHTTHFIANGQTVAITSGKLARHPVPQSGYLRATVTRSDGKKAWVQPARR
jgi:hypothetical protein